MAEGGDADDATPVDGAVSADATGVDGPVGDESAVEGATDRSATVVFMEALRVRRNATVGAAVGLLFAVFVFVSFPGAYAPSRSTAWYLALGFVLMFSIAGFVAFLLTLGRAVRLSRDL